MNLSPVSDDSLACLWTQHCFYCG